MKLTNITKNSSKLSQQLRLPLRKRGGINFTVVLNPGDSIFLEEKNNNNIIRIYEKKRFLSVSNEIPSDLQSFYVVYTEAALNNLNSTESTIAKFAVKEEGLPEEVKELEKLEIEVIVPEDSMDKPKGGRPKGSKNKSKRGRPKSKKSVGRPSKSKSK